MNCWRSSLKNISIRKQCLKYCSPGTDGETLMRPLAFYKKAMELQKKYANGRTIDNCIQTNGTLLTDEWCEFFKENNWLVGVSIDGPQEFHDEYREKQAWKTIPLSK